MTTRYLLTEPVVPLPGVTLDPGFLPDSAATMARVMHDVVWDTRIRARMTASYGVAYNYSGQEYPYQPMLPILQQCADLVAGRVGYPPNNCLLNLYPTGTSTMGFHFDAVDRLAHGSGISVISLGAERELVFRERADRDHLVHLSLPNGSLLHLTSELQHSWVHGLPRDETTSPRISLTFRLLQ